MHRLLEDKNRVGGSIYTSRFLGRGGLRSGVFTISQLLFSHFYSLNVEKQSVPRRSEQKQKQYQENFH